MDIVLDSILRRGDLAHLALFLWAVAASGLLLLTVRALLGITRRFDAFVEELTRFNRRVTGAGD